MSVTLRIGVMACARMVLSMPHASAGACPEGEGEVLDATRPGDLQWHADRTPDGESTGELRGVPVTGDEPDRVLIRLDIREPCVVAGPRSDGDGRRRTTGQRQHHLEVAPTLRVG